MIDPHGEAEDVISDVPELSVDEVEKRIGARKRERTQRAQEIAPTRVRTARANRRVILWRDSATILIFVVVALLAARFLLPDRNGVATGSQTPGPSEISIGSSPIDTGFNFSAPPTIGPPVDPSSAINATPTPIPLVTRRPGPTPSPTSTLKPGTTPHPTGTPPPATPPPPTPPHASFTASSCTAGGLYLVNFDASGSTPGSVGGSLTYAWNFDDQGATDTGVTTSHTYPSTTGTYTVFLTVTGTDSLTDTTSVNVVCT